MMQPGVILFDVNETLLDMSPVKEAVSTRLGPDSGQTRLWFTTMLQHSLVATVAGKYYDFAEIGAACLRMVAASAGVELAEKDAAQIVAKMRSLPAYPDVLPALQRLQKAGYRLFTLTNSSKSAVEDQMKNAGLEDCFEQLLSVEEVRKHKPATEVYAWAARKVGAPLNKCLLVAAHGWDVAGAAWAGMSTAFIARAGQQLFPLGPKPDLELRSLTELDALLQKQS